MLDKILYAAIIISTMLLIIYVVLRLWIESKKQDRDRGCE
jgi:hypothetical protein